MPRPEGWTSPGEPGSTRGRDGDVVCWESRLRAWQGLTKGDGGWAFWDKREPPIGLQERDAGGRAWSQRDSTVSKFSSNPISLLWPMSLTTQEAFPRASPQGVPPPSSALADTWHSVLFPQQAHKLLDSWAGPVYTFPTSPPRPETSENMIKSLSWE